MELKWLEDFAAFVRLGSFSRAAESRSVTQSGYSRRIRSLEEWLGADLIQRGQYPNTLTPAGELLAQRVSEIVETLYTLRSTVRNQQQVPSRSLSIASTQSLSTNFLPGWLTRSLGRFGEGVCARVIATNVHESVQLMLKGGCDMLLCYHREDQPILLDPQRYDCLIIGREEFIPVSAPVRGTQARYRITEDATSPIPLLAYTDTTYLGTTLKGHLAKWLPENRPLFSRVYESDTADVLRAAALSGLGMAWLPLTSIHSYLDAGALVLAADQKLCLDFELRLYCDINSGNELLRQVWSYLKSLQKI